MNRVSEIKQALVEFVRANGSQYALRTLQHQHVCVTNPVIDASEGGTIVVGNYAIKPTKWGVDTVDGDRARFWLFDQDTLQELDLVVGHKKLY